MAKSELSGKVVGEFPEGDISIGEALYTGVGSVLRFLGRTVRGGAAGTVVGAVVSRATGYDPVACMVSATAAGVVVDNLQYYVRHRKDTI